MFRMDFIKISNILQLSRICSWIFIVGFFNFPRREHTQSNVFPWVCLQNIVDSLQIDGIIFRRNFKILDKFVESFDRSKRNYAIHQKENSFIGE